MSTLQFNNAKLSFIWTAHFTDGSMISQFENNQERKFQEVKDIPSYNSSMFSLKKCLDNLIII